MKTAKTFLCSMLFYGAILLCMTGGLSAQEVPLVSGAELNSLMSMPDKPVVIDVRSEGDWSDSSEKIAGAVREDPHEVNSWADRYPRDARIILYCA